MRYLPPFSVLKHGVRLVSLRGQLKVDMTYEELLDLVKTLLRAIPFDEPWYCSTYPDVADAVARGAYRSAQQHFVEHGYFEGRLPFPLEVDEAWYLKTYPDVGTSVSEGAVISALDHFVRHGYEEGRRPGEV